MAQIEVKVYTPVGSFIGVMPMDGDQIPSAEDLHTAVEAIGENIETIERLQLIDYTGNRLAFPTATLQNSVFQFRVIED
jgi:hypothetical protein